MSASCPTCHHLHPTGQHCGSPALRGEQFCSTTTHAPPAHPHPALPHAFRRIAHRRSRNPPDHPLRDHPPPRRQHPRPQTRQPPPRHPPNGQCQPSRLTRLPVPGTYSRQRVQHSTKCRIDNREHLRTFRTRPNSSPYPVSTQSPPLRRRIRLKAGGRGTPPGWAPTPL